MSRSPPSPVAHRGPTSSSSTHAPVTDSEESLAALRATADEALRTAALDPVGARALAASVLDQAVARHAWLVLSRLERALGVAAMNLSDCEVAIRHLNGAVAAAHRARSVECEAEARMSLASALVLQGRSVQARRQIELALRVLTGLPAARAGVQHAAILQELGHDDAALAAVRTALPTLRDHADAEWAARALSNRSLIHVQRRAFRAAESDLLEALRLCDQQHLDLPAGYAEQNLGCLDAQRGDVPAALRHFDAAQRRYQAFGIVEPSLLLDYARVLLSVRLLEEARSNAEAAVSAFAGQHRAMHLPDARLLLSTIALVQGDQDTARGAADAAVEGFRRLGRKGSVTLARYAGVQAALASDPASVSGARLARLSDLLQEAGWTVPALEARVLAGRVALERGRPTAARRHLRTASRARFSGPADARGRAWLAEALLRRAEGRRGAASAALRAGIRIVDEHQATLGATELRAHVSAHRGALARWGLRMALEDRNARRVLWWAERDRASALRMRPARPPDDPALAQDLADLRSTMAEIEEARGEGDRDETLLHRQLRLERSVRDRCRTLTASAVPGGAEQPDVLEEVTSLLGDAALIEFVHLDDVLHAITVVDHRVQLHTLGSLDPVRRLLTHVPFALARLANPRAGTVAGSGAASAVLDRAASTFDKHLIGPLLQVVQDRPVVIVPTGGLQSLPWAMVPSCVGRPVTTSPSSTLWRRAVTAPDPAPGARVLVVAGPQLPGAEQEATAIGALYPGATVLTGPEATSARVLRLMDGAGRLHVAAHGKARADNPLFSALCLADGPLTVHELESLVRPPHQVSLAACDTGRPHRVAGEEVLGIAAALLGVGTATLVAPVVPVPDAATVPLMCGYHTAVRRGVRPAEALARVQAGTDRAEGARWAAAVGFVCLGAG